MLLRVLSSCMPLRSETTWNRSNFGIAIKNAEWSFAVLIQVVLFPVFRHLKNELQSHIEKNVAREKRAYTFHVSYGAGETLRVGTDT